MLAKNANNAKIKKFDRKEELGKCIALTWVFQKLSIFYGQSLLKGKKLGVD
jgi:hypothetical protein